MPSSTSSFRADSCTYPSDWGLGRLASTIHSVAQGRGLSEKVAGRYEAWIFVFLGWCLRAPPRREGRDRVGGFWMALTQREVPKWKICVAMDALGFFFGALGRSEKLSSYLPNRPLPTGVDARRYVPISNPKENKEKDGPASEPGIPSEPKTLFNQEGEARPQKTSASKKEDKKEQASRGQGPSPEDSPRKAPPHKASPQSETPSPSEEKAVPSSQPPARSEPKRVPIEIPETIAERVKEGVRELGLPPGLFAVRALDLACNETGVGRAGPADPQGPTERYQTRSSSFHSTGQGQPDAPSPTEDRAGNPDPPESDRTGPKKGAENSSRIGTSSEGRPSPEKPQSHMRDGSFGVA